MAVVERISQVIEAGDVIWPDEGLRKLRMLADEQKHLNGGLLH